jgi:hypothetical protein
MCCLANFLSHMSYSKAFLEAERGLETVLDEYAKQAGTLLPHSQLCTFSARLELLSNKFFLAHRVRQRPIPPSFRRCDLRPVFFACSPQFRIA